MEHEMETGSILGFTGIRILEHSGPFLVGSP